MIRRQAMSVRRLANVLERDNGAPNAATQADQAESRTVTFIHVGPPTTCSAFQRRFFYFLRAEQTKRQQEKHSLRRFNRAIPGKVPAMSGKVPVKSALLDVFV
jgi:hypothetical protein